MPDSLPRIQGRHLLTRLCDEHATRALANFAREAEAAGWHGFFIWGKPITMKHNESTHEAHTLLS